MRIVGAFQPSRIGVATLCSGTVLTSIAKVRASAIGDSAFSQRSETRLLLGNQTIYLAYLNAEY